MAIQTFRGRPGLGELFGTGIGSGISKGLEELAKLKADNLKAQNMRAYAQALYGKPRQAVAGQEGEMAAPQQATTIDKILSLPVGSSQQEQFLLQQLGREGIAQQKLAQQKELAEKKMEQRERLFEKGLTEKQQTRIDKETEKSYRNIKELGEEANATIPYMEAYKDILKSSKTPSAGWNTLMAFVGENVLGKNVPDDWLYTDDVNLRRKFGAQVVKQMLKKVKGIKSKAILKSLERTIPSVYQSIPTQLRIADAVIYEKQLNRVQDRISDQIIKENDGHRPRNYDQLISDAMKKLEPLIAQQYLSPEDRSL